MARDVQRKCTICGNEGRAEKMSEREAKQPPLVGRGLTRRPQDLARQSMHEAKLATFTRQPLHKVRFHAGDHGAQQVQASKFSHSEWANTIECSPASPSAGVEATPFRRFERRYWDGQRWTERVSNGHREKKDRHG